MQHGRHGQKRAANHRRSRAQQQRGKYHRFKGNICGQKVWHHYPDPDPQREWNADERQHAERLRGAAALVQQEILEYCRPYERA